MTGRFISIWMVLIVAGAGWVAGVQRVEAFDHAALARAAIDGHIRPGYRRQLEAFRTLSQVTQRLCSAPSGDALARTRAAFRVAVRARAAMEHIRFGPVGAKNRFERIAFWPDPKGVGRRQVRRALKSRKPGLDNATALSGMSVALQGLTALEIVLFGKAAEAKLVGAGATGFDCRVALAITQNLLAIATDVDQEWANSEGYAAAMLHPGAGNPIYLSPQEVTLDLIDAFMTGLVFARDRKIEGPVGDVERARPKSVEFRLSLSGRLALQGNVDGFEDFYRKGGLRDALAKIAPERVKRADDNFALARAMIAAVGKPLELAVNDETETDRLITLSLAFSGARSAVGKGITLAAGLSRGFNAGDGD